MSVITDHDYFLQSLRLAFLRLDSPLAASTTAHLAQSTPAYALSQHALQAGLAPEVQPDFGLSHSLGPIPSTSSSSNPFHGSAVASSHARPNRSAAAAGGLRDRGLRHSETIVGRHGGPSSTSNNNRAAPGTRVKGKRSSWKPKPHQLQALRAEQGLLPTTSDTASDKADLTPHLVVDSPDVTPQPSLRSRSRREERSTTNSDTDSDDQHDPEILARRGLVAGAGGVGYQPSPLAAQPAPLLVPDTTLADTEPSSNPLISNNFTSQPLDKDRSADSRAPAAWHGGSSDAGQILHSEAIAKNGADFDEENDTVNSSTSLTTHGADADTESRDGGYSLDGRTTSQSDGFEQESYSDEEADAQGLDDDEEAEEEDGDGEDVEYEEDDFEFSLHGRDGTSSFENSLSVGQQGSQASVMNARGVGKLVSPSTSFSHATALPSIAEAAEHGNGDGGTPALDPEAEAAATLKAAQIARRKARRRVNISGKVPININIPLSPDLPPDPATSPPPAAASGSNAALNGVASPSGTSVFAYNPARSMSPHRVRTPTGSTSNTPTRPLSPLSAALNASLAQRPKSATARLRSRQRSKTEPGSVSASLRAAVTPLASPGLAAGSTEADRSAASSLTVTANPSRQNSSTLPPVSDSPSGRKVVRQPLSPLSSAENLAVSPRRSLDEAGNVGSSSNNNRQMTAEDEEDQDGNMTEPVKPLNIRSKSAGASTHPRVRAHSSAAVTSTSLRAREATSLSPLSSLAAPAAASREGALSPEAALSAPVRPPGTPLTTTTTVSPAQSASRSSARSQDPYVNFPISRQAVVPFDPPKQSALSLMLRAQETSPGAGSSNPFNELYGALFAPASNLASGTNASGPTAARRRGPMGCANTYDVTVYYPFSRERGKPIKMSLKADLVIEEVLGCALWKYWEDERRPSLCPDSDGNNEKDWEDKADAEAKRKLAVTSWVLRIADEDEDGEVDDDFPAPDRTRAAKGFGNCFAALEASPAQAKQNVATDAQIQRKPSRIIKKMRRAASSSNAGSDMATLAPPPVTNIIPAGGGAPTAASLYSASFTGTPAAKASSFSMAGGSTAPLVYLRVRIPLRAPEAITTTVQVPSDMYLADVLELICKKKFLENPKDWILIIPDRGIIVPLDRTVESLQGSHHLALQRRSTVSSSAAATSAVRTNTGGLQNTNPNASIFKRLSEPPQPKYVSSADLNTNYRSYVVQRKMPMPLGRHERILSLDNDYIHIMPSDTKLISGTVRTASYHVSQVAACKQSRRAPASFKLIVWRDKDRDVKRYDFEASNGRTAGEIVQMVQSLMLAYKESVEREQQQQHRVA